MPIAPLLRRRQLLLDFSVAAKGGEASLRPGVYAQAPGRAGGQRRSKVPPCRSTEPVRYLRVEFSPPPASAPSPARTIIDSRSVIIARPVYDTRRRVVARRFVDSRRLGSVALGITGSRSVALSVTRLRSVAAGVTRSRP